MFNALITLVINSVLYFRKTELAYVPRDGDLIDVHTDSGLTLGLKVTQTRNRIGKTEIGLAVRTYPLPDDKIKLPKTDGDSRPTPSMLKQMDEILRNYGFERISHDAIEPARVMRAVQVSNPHDLRVVFTKACTLQWLAIDKNDPSAVAESVVVSGVLSGLRTIEPCEDDEHCWLLTSRIIGDSTPLYTLVRKDAVTIPPSRSVEVEFLEGLDPNWILPDGRIVGDHFDKHSKRQFKAAIANPLNPDQIAFVEQDNKFVLLHSNCFKHIKLPAGDLTNLPKFPSLPGPLPGRSGPIMFHVLGDHNPDDESMIGFVDKEGRRTRKIRGQETLYATSLQISPSDHYTVELYDADGSRLRIPLRNLVIDKVDAGSDIYYMKRGTESVVWKKPGTTHHTETMRSGENYNASALERLPLARRGTPVTYKFTGVEERTAVLQADAFSIYQINPQKLPLEGDTEPKRPGSIWGWATFTREYTAETQLADDTVRRKFEKEETVLVRTLRCGGDITDDVAELRLVDGHLWRVPSSLLTRAEWVFWIQMRSLATVVVRNGLGENKYEFPMGARILVKGMSLTGYEADLPGPNRHLRTFSLDHGSTFQLPDNTYSIGQVPLIACGRDPVSAANGLTNIFFKLPKDVVTNVGTTTRTVSAVMIPAGQYLARLVEVDQNHCVITMPDWSYFRIPKDECKLIGGHAIEAPQNNAPYHLAVATATKS